MADTSFVYKQTRSCIARGSEVFVRDLRDKQSHNMCEVETGVQIVHRISSRLSSSVTCLDPNVFPDGRPLKGETVEIFGESNCGKSCLILEFVAKIILPEDCGGHGVAAVFVDCDNNVNMARLLNVMEKQIINCSPANRIIDRQEIRRIRQESFSRLTIIKCFTLDEFEFSLLTLNEVFIKNPLSVYLLIDSISAFYWNKCTEKNLIRMDTYLRSLHARLKKLCHDRKIVALFTRPSYFGLAKEAVQPDLEFGSSISDGVAVTQMSTSVGATLATASSSITPGGHCIPVDHRIELAEVVSETPSDNKKFNAFVTSKDKQYIKFFIIDAFGIDWLSC